LSPNITTRDITLSGSAHYIAGSDDETGTATLKAIATGASRIDLSLSSGPRSEARDLTASAPAGTWSGADGISHTIVYHNLLNEPSWFAPAAAVFRLIASPESVASFVGTETLDAQGVQHISVIQEPQASASPTTPAFLPHLTRVDLYLDSSTSLPAAMKFNVHPDDDAHLDIPVEVRYSDYRTVNGTQIPFHVQKLLNNSLVLDLQFQSAAINSGISPNALAIQ
jgi:hypothetical protein